MNFKNLDSKQLKVLESFINADNIFMSGPAGTGKSYLISIIKDMCMNTNKKCQVTALTGCAALLLDCQAKTLHSWAGIAVVKDDFKYHLRKIKNRKEKLNNWKTVDVLIIDEISMMSMRLFDLLDFIGRQIRQVDKPFGGIQLLFSGDFYQLPPVCKNDENPDNGRFCFESENWSTIFPQIHTLTKIFRQSDPIFTKILNEIRVGRIKRSSVELLEQRKITYKKNDNIIPTMVLPYRNKVDLINKKEHDLLKSSICKTYELVIITPVLDSINCLGINPSDIDKEIELYQTSNIYQKSIEIKIGDQVICTRNISDSVVNGSRGVVVDIKEYPIVEFVGKIQMEIKPVEIPHDTIKGLYFRQIPLNHAWALTIHKCQGMTLDLCIMDIGSNIFECGQTYVALSRVKSLEGLYLTAFEPCKILINGKVKQFYEGKLNFEKKLTKEERLKLKKQLRVYINNWLEKNKCEYVEPEPVVKIKTHLETFQLYVQDKSVNEICKMRNLTKSTVIDHLIKSIPYPTITYDKFMTEEEYTLIKENLNLTYMKPIKDTIEKLDILDVDITHDKIKICKALHPELVTKIIKPEKGFSESEYEINQELYIKLKKYRSIKSTDVQCPAYQVFNNKVLDSLSKCPIQTVDDFIKIKGIGGIFIEKYADDVLEIIMEISRKCNSSCVNHIEKAT